MAKGRKSNVTVMAEKLYKLAEDKCAEALVVQFGFKIDDKSSEEEKEKAKKATNLVRSHFRNFLGTLNIHGVLDQSMLTSIRVLEEEE